MKYIYALVDPRDKRIRYIGQTDNLSRRLQEHSKDIAGTVKVRWLAELKALGLVPAVIILGEHDGDYVSYWENWWIVLGRRQGWPLTNGTNPGEWRVANDFSAIFSEQLLRLQQDYDANCETINHEAIERAIGQERSVSQERLSKAHDGWWFLLYVFVGLFISFGVADMAYSAWLHPDNKLPLLASAAWALQFSVIYFHHVMRSDSPDYYKDVRYWLFYPPMMLCDIVAGIQSLIHLGTVLQ